MITGLWVVLAALVAAAGLARRAKLREIRRKPTPTVDDETIGRILEEGRLEAEGDEPLDLDEVARAEEEFWSEEWDRPDEFHP